MNSRKLKNIGKSRRGVEPVLAAMAIIALSLVGSSTVVLYSDEMFEDYTVEGKVFELISIAGYDTRDEYKLKIHDGSEIELEDCCIEEEQNTDRRISIFVKNLSEEPIRIKNLIVAENEYSFVSVETVEEWNENKENTYEFIMIRGKTGGEFSVIQGNHAAILPEETVTLVLSLNELHSIGKGIPIKLSTSNGNFFISGIETGKFLD